MRGRVAYEGPRGQIGHTRELSFRRAADRGADYGPAATRTFTYQGAGDGVTVVQRPTRRVRYLSANMGSTTTFLATVVAPSLI